MKDTEAIAALKRVRRRIQAMAREEENVSKATTVKGLQDACVNWTGGLRQAADAVTSEIRRLQEQKEHGQ